MLDCFHGHFFPGTGVVDPQRGGCAQPWLLLLFRTKPKPNPQRFLSNIGRCEEELLCGAGTPAGLFDGPELVSQDCGDQGSRMPTNPVCTLLKKISEITFSRLGEDDTLLGKSHDPDNDKNDLMGPKERRSRSKLSERGNR